MLLQTSKTRILISLWIIPPLCGLIFSCSKSEDHYLKGSYNLIEERTILKNDVVQSNFETEYTLNLGNDTGNRANHLVNESFDWSSSESQSDTILTISTDESFAGQYSMTSYSSNNISLFSRNVTQFFESENGELKLQTLEDERVWRITSK